MRMRKRLGRLTIGAALFLLPLLAAAQEEGAPQFLGRRARPGMAARRGVAFDGLALREKEFHIVSLRLIGPKMGRKLGAAAQEEPETLPGGRKAVGLLLFGTGRFGVILEATAPAKVIKGTIVALKGPSRLKGEGSQGRGPARVPGALMEALEKGRKVGALELQVKPYEGRIVATGKAEFTEGTYKGSWRLILFTRPMMRRPLRPGRLQAPAAE